MSQKQLKHSAFCMVFCLLFISLFPTFSLLSVIAAGILGDTDNPYQLSIRSVSPSYIANSKIVSINASMEYPVSNTPPFSLSTTTQKTIQNSSGTPNALSLNSASRGRWSFQSDASFTIKLDDNSATASTNTYSIEIYGLRYTGSSNRQNPELVTFSVTSGSETNYFSCTIPASYFTDTDTSDTSSTTAETYTSDIAVEDIVVRDYTTEQVLAKVDKNSTPFNITVSFRDYGLEKAAAEDMLDNSYSALVTDWGGFRSNSTNGTNVISVEKRTTSSEGAPRFILTIPNLTYNGETNQIKIRINYRIDDTTISNKDLTLTIVQAITTKEEEEDENKISPLKPYIIVNQYNYGENEIIAGSNFSLNFDYKNTSRDIPLENIVISVAPPEDLSIATASNTTYVSSLAANGTGSYSLDLEVKPSAKVGSAELTITFTYQYIDYVTKTRMDNTTTEKIAIPITQMDRFSVTKDTGADNIESTVDEPFTITLNMVNRGQSSTYNISATATADKEITVSEVYFGSLAANKSDTLDLDITCKESGDLTGEIILKYEDENTNQKEITLPFSAYISEIEIPPDIITPPDISQDTQNSSGISAITIALFGSGALLLASPLVYYFIKRTKKKESEGFDEDF